MAHASFLAIISFGVIGVQPKLINILGDEYDSSVNKTYRSATPTGVEFRFVNGSSSLLGIVENQGYYIGPLGKFGNIIQIPKRFYTPISRNDNFTDLFGNRLFCETGELEMKRTKKRYKIGLGSQASIIECFLDNRKSRVFLICGKTKNAKRGKLYAFDTKNFDIHGENILTQEMVAVGDNITAVTVGRHGGEAGVVVLIEELSDQNSFNIIFLNEKGKTFNEATERASEKITDHFNKILQSRVDRLAKDNSRLRSVLEAQLKKIKKHEHTLPEKVTDRYSISKYAEVESALDKMRKKMNFLYQRDTFRNDTKRYAVLGNRSRRSGLVPLPRVEPEVAFCRNRTGQRRVVECATETRFENKYKDFVVSEKAFVEMEEWLGTGAGDETKGIVGVINILGRDYEVNTPRNFSDARTFLEYQREVFSLIGTKFKTQPSVLNDPAHKTFNREVTLNFGNVMHCDGNGRATFEDRNANPSKNYVIKTGNSPFTFQCYADLKRNRVFLLSGNKRNPSTGRLFAFDTSEVDILNGEVVTEEVAEVEDGISVVSVRDSDGVILLSQEVIASKRKTFKMILLKPTSEEVIPSKNKMTATHLITAASSDSSTLYSTYDAEESEFIDAIVEAENSLVSILRAKWKVRSEKLRKEQEQLKILGEVLKTYFTAVNDGASRYSIRQSLVSLLALNDTRAKNTFDDELRARIEDTGKDVFKKYVKGRTLIRSEFQLLELEAVCNGSVTEKNELYACVRSKEWKEREKFHEKLQSFFDEIMEFNSF